MSSFQSANTILKQALRACYRESGIIAGPHHFTDYWARDGFFAAFGAKILGDNRIIDQMINLFFSHQRPDGLIPYRIMRGPLSLGKYFGKPTFYPTPKPTYRLRGIGPEILDGTTLSILWAAKRHQKHHQDAINRALTYLESRERHHLLWDGVMAEWNDIALKWGHLLYSNIIYWKMYDELAKWQSQNKQFAIKKNKIQQAIRQILWNGEFFADWHDFKRQDYFYPYGNCLAIAWGFTTPTETASILTKCQSMGRLFTLTSNYPKYPWWRIDPLQRLAGVTDYQNDSVLWWQPIASYLAALKSQGDNNQTEQVIAQITQKISTDQQVYECYETNGQPMKRLLYQAEHPFAWAAGLLIWAIDYNKAI